MQNLDLFIAHYGYIAIFGLLMLGIVGPLIPDETILVLAGIAVHRGQLDYGNVITTAFAGSLCGITLSYLLGRSGIILLLERYEPMRRWIRRHMPQVEMWYRRYGKWTLFFGYFIAGVRHFTALAAGLSRVKVSTFAAYAYPGGFVWVFCFVSIGYYLGAEWEKLLSRFHRGGAIAVAVLVAIALGGWWLRRRNAEGRL